jgi:hypothetical protein
MPDTPPSPTFELVDPRPSAASAPYTYFLPLAPRLEAIAPKDLVQLVFRAVPASDEWDAERMWVKVKSVGPDEMEGELDSTPCDVPGLQAGARVQFVRSFVIDVIFDDPEKEKRIPKDLRREYWERCLVDRCVLDDRVPVHYIYREQPDMGDEDDKYPDSGWRIRGDMRTCSEEDLAARELEYVALGAVLNEDDSWLHLIDEPIGSAFEREFETGAYLATEQT